MPAVPKEFFAGTTIGVAKRLLGTFLWCDSPEGPAAGRIVETEAYLSGGDPACHAHRGLTARNESMFGAAGRSYVYLIYGMHYCFNVVTADEGVGEAVLIRALEPVEGLELMKHRRGPVPVRNLCRGPGNLAAALGISKQHNGLILTRGPLKILAADSYPEQFPARRRPKITTTPRIGISQAIDLPLRFYLTGSPYVSKLSR